MKRMISTASKVVAELALKVTSANVNSICLSIGHQPKLPNNAEKLKKK